MSFLNVSANNSSRWKSYQITALQFFILFFAIEILPLDWKFYRELFSINWTELNFYDLFKLTRYTPQFFSLTGYANWLVAILLAAAGTVIWRLTDRKEGNYDQLYYWLRVGLRYRLAIGIIAYGFIKLFPLQMPYPSLSNLHTNYGDFMGWKIYWHTLGITQGYESFLGFVEIAAGLLLLHRRTTTFGAGIILGFTGNVVAANFAYNAGEQVYSSFLVLISLFLFLHDVPRLYNLLARQRFTIANKFSPAFSNRIRNARRVFKIAFLAFILFYGVETYANYTTAPYKIPKTPGLAGTYGYYNVKEFVFNKDTIGYSTTDPDRWQNVVFEKWATISVKIARPVKVDLSTGDEFHENDIDRNFESAGVGGRHYFDYRPDTSAHTLVLENKNKNHADEKFYLKYSIPNDSSILLDGTDEKNNSLHIVLERINKKYMLFEGRRKPVKL
jgi:hypothetical protein